MNINKLVISFLGFGLIVMTLLATMTTIELAKRNEEQILLKEKTFNSEKEITELKKLIVEINKKPTPSIAVLPKVLNPEIALPSRGILNDYDLTRPSGRTEKEINYLLTDTKLSNLGKVTLEAEKQFGVNAIFIISVAQLESGYGSSYLARTKNNLFGLNAWGNTTSEIRRRAYSYKTKGDCIKSFAEIIRTKYLDKKRTTISSIGEIYCEKSEYWVDKITILMGQNVKKMNELKEK
jgi:beta-N-acetylglucosaminidase